MLKITEGTASLHDWIHLAVVAMEALAVIMIVAGIVYGAVEFTRALFRPDDRQAAYHTFRVFVGRTLLLALEVLVAADVVYTVALDPTLESVSVLGLLVLIRTFLGWSLVVEIEGHWPWKAQHAKPSETAH